MNERNKENLTELFEKFAEGEQAERAAEDIQQGEQIFHSFNAPEPEGELIAGIKAEIAANLLHKKENAFRGTVYKTMAVAAAFILIAVISVKLFEKGESKPQRPAVSSAIPKTVWESECLADDSADLAALVAEVEQTEKDVLALRTDENVGNGYETATELEMELTEINGDFWKG